MLRRKIGAIAPIVMLVLVGACSDSTGPRVPELAQTQEEAEDSGSDQTRGSDSKAGLDNER